MTPGGSPSDGPGSPTAPLATAAIGHSILAVSGEETPARVDPAVVRGEPGPLIVRAARGGRHDAIFMSLRGEYRALDTAVKTPSSRYVLQNAPCRVILGFAPRSIQPAAAPGASWAAAR
jgi:hypothetical protein